MRYAIPVTTVTEWIVVDRLPPVMCVCGHLHYARHTRNMSLAERWHLCEDYPDCDCGTLIHADLMGQEQTDE